MGEPSPTVLQARIEFQEEFARHTETRAELEAEKKQLTDKGNEKHKPPAEARILAAAVEEVNRRLKEEDMRHNRRKSEIARKLNVPIPSNPTTPARPMSTTSTSTTYDLTVGVIGWIDGGLLQQLGPVELGFAGINPMEVGGVKIEVSWPARVLIGLTATANPNPGMSITDIAAFRKMQQYRCLIWCRMLIDVNRRTDRVTRVNAVERILDPGFTPPFDFGKIPFGDIAQKLVSEASFKDRRFHAGEMSPLSSVAIQERHPNSSQPTLNATEQVVANAVLKFRAGAVTDATGIRDAKCPFHVPWTWTELLVTYRGNGMFNCASPGAVFPTQGLYVDGMQRKVRPQKVLRADPMEPAFTTGAPARVPTTPTDAVPANIPDTRQSGPVPSHMFTLPRATTISSELVTAKVSTAR